MRPAEWLPGIYFSGVALRCLVSGAPASNWAWQCGLALGGWAACLLLVPAAARFRPLLVSVARDWLPAPLLLVAYWAADWGPAPVYNEGLERAWLAIDRVLLHDWGGRAAIEVLGPVVPFLIEFCYSALYATPPLAIGWLYVCRKRERVDRFLFTVLLAALTTYSLLPFFPSRSPRAGFPGEDLPGYTTPFRRLNLWLLDHGDIHTSVFPSGHVTIGISSAFAMLLALPEKKRAAAIIGVVAAGVAVVTVYGRYHYAVDGVAAAGISLLAAGAALLLHPDLRLAWLPKRLR